MSRRTILECLVSDLEQDIRRLRNRFNCPDNARLTLVVRSPDLDDGHAVLGNDEDLRGVIATIQRYIEAPPQYTPAPVKPKQPRGPTL